MDSLKYAQKIAACLLCLLLLLPVFSACAEETGFAFDAATGTITGWTGQQAQLRLPASIGGVQVTGIASGAFQGLDTLETVIFPESITSIDKKAFSDCASLSYIIFESARLPRMAVYAFDNCPIKDIDIPWNATRTDAQAAQKQAREAGLSAKVWRGNAPELELIGEGYAYEKDGKKGYLLSGYTGAQSHIYPHYALIHTDGTELPVYGIGEGAFRGQQQLKGFGVPHSDKFTTIGKEAFASSDLTRIDLYDTVASIGEGAFRDCTSLTEITLTSSVKTVGGDAFSGCTALDTIYLQCGSSALPEGSFADCTSLTTLYADTKQIGDRMFADTTLSTAEFSQNVEVIGAGAFQGTAITQLTLPETIRKVGKGAFDDCASLETVTIRCNASALPSDAFSGCTALKTVIVEKGSIPDDFLKNSSIEVLVLGEAVTSIGENAFADTALQGVVLPAGTSLEAGAFQNVAPQEIRIADAADESKLLSLSKALNRPWYMPLLRESDPSVYETMPQLPETTDGLRFDAATGSIIGYDGSAATVVVPSVLDGIPVTTIASLAPQQGISSSIETLILPNSVQAIGSNAFTACSRLRTFITYGPTETLGERAFAGCTSLETACFVNGVYRIEASAFDGCSELTTLWWSGCADSVGENAFRGSGLTAFSLPARRLTTGAFSQCRQLTEVHLRPCTTYIDTLVFDGCPSLTTLCFHWNDPELFKRYARIGAVSPDATVILPVSSKKKAIQGMYRILCRNNDGPLSNADEIVLADCAYANTMHPDMAQLLETLSIP